MKKNTLCWLAAAGLATACAPDTTEAVTEKDMATTETDSFLTAYSSRYQSLYYASSQAEWELNTHIEEGDTMRAYRAEKTGKAFADYTGSNEVVNTALRLLERDDLSPLQTKQLEKVVYVAGANPQMAKDLVLRKIKAENEQTEKLFGYHFRMNGYDVSPNYIDSVLENSDDLPTRLAAWRSSKEVGRGLKDGLENLQDLRNRTVQALNYENYFDFQVSDYGMTTQEMMDLNHQLISEIWPLYRQLHTWARHELAERFNQPVPDYLPAHWLPNRWGQEWSSMVEVEGLSFDNALKEKGAEWIVEQGEDFYVSLGYEKLPQSFYTKSSLYPLPPDAGYKKNNHASAWHMDLQDDVRSLMSIEPNSRWWNTTLHELGHVYYFQLYSADSIPVLLRAGANRAYHEAIGTLIGLASMQKPFLVEQGLVPAGTKTDSLRGLLKEALDYIVVMPWASGVMTDFEHALYTQNLPKDQYNKKWWELKKKYQGIVPPGERGEEYCDACSKTHINNDPAQYYDYALANVLLFQFHMHIAENILNQHPHASNYYGSKETGEFLSRLMAPGATQDWRESLRENLDSEISAKAIQAYFNPLMKWLEKQNQGRKHTLPVRLG